MSLESRPAGPRNYVTVDAPAEIDIATSPALREAIAAALEERPWVIVDFSNVDFIDSSGLSVLLWGHKTAAAQGGGLVLVGVPERTTKIFRLTQLDRIFDVYPSKVDVPPWDDGYEP